MSKLGEEECEQLLKATCTFWLRFRTQNRKDARRQKIVTFTHYSQELAHFCKDKLLQQLFIRHLLVLQGLQRVR